MLKGFCIAVRHDRRMHDLSIPILVADFFRQDPFTALGLIGFVCVAISATTDFDLLHVLGFADLDDEQSGESSVA